MISKRNHHTLPYITQHKMFSEAKIVPNQTASVLLIFFRSLFASTPVVPAIPTEMVFDKDREIACSDESSQRHAQRIPPWFPATANGGETPGSSPNRAQERKPAAERSRKEAVRPLDSGILRPV
jgi:hypothetical protein